MARIYYHEEKLNGQAFENEIINLQLFDFIFKNTNTNGFEIKPISTTSFFGLFKSKKETFKRVSISRDGINYKTTEGSFYLPNAIIFYDNYDYNFPSEFYFIAKLGNKIEIRKCNGGKDVKWFQIPNLHQKVNDNKIISKIENTLLEVKKLVETTHNKQIDIDREKKEEEKRRKIEANRPFLNDIQKKAYQDLTNLCVFKDVNKVKILDFIEKLKNYDNDSEYYTTLNYFMEFLDENEFGFIMRMDWKAEIETLEWLLNSAITENYNLNINLPNSKNYNDELTVSEDGIFEDYDRPLRENGLQLGFIDTQSDEYIAILHKIKDKENVEETINKIGYDYYEK